MSCPCRRPSSEMESSHLLLAGFALVFLLSVPAAEGLKCFVCNSADFYEGNKCLEPELHEEDILKDCAEEGIRDGLNYTMCRKMFQSVDGDDRVVRTCASHGTPDYCAERTGTKKIRVTYCECEGDKCNSATSFSIPAVSMVTVALLLAARFS